MIKTIASLFPAALTQPLLALATQKRDWCVIVLDKERRKYCVQSIMPIPAWLERLTTNQPEEYLGLLSISHWLVDGPKIARPTPHQFEALENVEIRLELPDFAMPFPTLLVEFPESTFFRACLLYLANPHALICNLITQDHQHDICTVVTYVPGEMMEQSLTAFDEGVKDHTEEAARCLRVAVNFAMLLAGQELKVLPCLPHDVARDRRLGQEATNRGDKARERLRNHLHEVSLAQDVCVCREVSQATDNEIATPGVPTGREMPFHWRRGHWHIYLHGPGKTLRKRVLMPAIKVREDKLLVPLSQTSANYTLK
jgi:hypothetical protein